MKSWTRDTEDVLWTLHKGERAAEARVSIDGAQPELRIYATRETKGKFGLFFSQVVRDTRAARALAAEKRAESEAQGWSLPA